MASIIDQLILHEGIRLKPYKCTAGKWTIGVGHNYQDVKIDKECLELIGLSEYSTTEQIQARLNKGVTVDWCQKLLVKDVARYEKQLRIKFQDYDELDFVRQKVMLDMTFNMGAGWIDNFKNTIKKIYNKDFTGAAKGMEASKWYKDVKRRAERLCHMMKTGIDYDAKGGFGAK